MGEGGDIRVPWESVFRVDAWHAELAYASTGAIPLKQRKNVVLFISEVRAVTTPSGIPEGAQCLITCASGDHAMSARARACPVL